MTTIASIRSLSRYVAPSNLMHRHPVLPETTRFEGVSADTFTPKAPASRISLKAIRAEMALFLSAKGTEPEQLRRAFAKRYIREMARAVLKLKENGHLDTETGKVVIRGRKTKAQAEDLVRVRILGLMEKHLQSPLAVKFRKVLRQINYQGPEVTPELILKKALQTRAESIEAVITAEDMDPFAGAMELNARRIGLSELFEGMRAQTPDRLREIFELEVAAIPKN